MPLDLDCTDPMYLLGRVVAVIDEGHAKRAKRVSDGPELDILLSSPARGFGLLSRKFGRRMSEPHVAEMMAILPQDLPAGPVSIEDQGPFWLGYYHQRGAERADYALSAKFDPDTLRAVGEALYGPDHWQAEMTRALGLTDSSRIRAWLSDNRAKRRRVPAGVCRDLIAMLRHKSDACRALASEIGE
jgi:hypothetical protein